MAVTRDHTHYTRRQTVLRIVTESLLAFKTVRFSSSIYWVGLSLILFEQNSDSFQITNWKSILSLYIFDIIYNFFIYSPDQVFSSIWFGRVWFGSLPIPSCPYTLSGKKETKKRTNRVVCLNNRLPLPITLSRIWTIFILRSKFQLLCTTFLCIVQRVVNSFTKKPNFI